MFLEIGTLCTRRVEGFRWNWIRRGYPQDLPQENYLLVQYSCCPFFFCVCFGTFEAVLRLRTKPLRGQQYKNARIQEYKNARIQEFSTAPATRNCNKKSGYRPGLDSLITKVCSALITLVLKLQNFLIPRYFSCGFLVCWRILHYSVATSYRLWQQATDYRLDESAAVSHQFRLEI